MKIYNKTVHFFKILMCIMIVVNLILDIIILKSINKTQNILDDVSWDVNSIDSEINTINDNIETINNNIDDIQYDVDDIKYYLE